MLIFFQFNLQPPRRRALEGRGRGPAHTQTHFTGWPWNRSLPLLRARSPPLGQQELVENCLALGDALLSVCELSSLQVFHAQIGVCRL